MKLFCLIEAAKGDEMGLLGGWVDGEVKRECGDDGWCESSFDRCQDCVSPPRDTVDYVRTFLTSRKKKARAHSKLPSSTNVSTSIPPHFNGRAEAVNPHPGEPKQ
jgi:hypothetical protein